MREIKFRVWIKNRMLYDVSGQLLFQYSTLTEFFKKCNDKNIPIMQFTGFKDKNGKEIYEGDIVEEKSKFFAIKIFKIVWRIDMSCFLLTNSKDKKDWYPLFSRTDVEKPICRYLEVIGNIYENPELLKGTNDH